MNHTQLRRLSEAVTEFDGVQFRFDRDTLKIHCELDYKTLWYAKLKADEVTQELTDCISPFLVRHKRALETQIREITSP